MGVTYFPLPVSVTFFGEVKVDGILILLIWAIGIGILVGTGILASRKGRSVPLWVILGLFFGPIPLIILAFLSPMQKPA